MADQSRSSDNLRRDPKIINPRLEDHLDKVKELQDGDHPLSDWEERFLRSMYDLLTDQEELTDQQAHKLNEIYEKYS